MHVAIKAKTRKIEKRSDLNRYRKEGFIPAVVYGGGKEGKNILIDKIDFQKGYRKTIGNVAIFDIEIDGEEYPTFIKDKQIHPVTREFVHIDFVELHKGKPITLEIPFNFVGVAKGSKEGGVVEYLLRTIEISCLPKDLPEEIEVDISNIGVGEALHFSEITLPENITTTMADTTTLVSVKEPKMHIEPLEAEEGEEKVVGEADEDTDEGTSEPVESDEETT